MRSVALSTLVLSALALTGCADREDFYFFDYEADVRGAPIAANASVVELHGWVDLERTDSGWDCEVSTDDVVTLDGELSSLGNLTSDSYGDVVVIDEECEADVFEDGGTVDVELEVTYRVLNLVYGDGEAELELSASFDRREGPSEANVDDYLLCIDSDCVTQ